VRALCGPCDLINTENQGSQRPYFALLINGAWTVDNDRVIADQLTPSREIASLRTADTTKIIPAITRTTATERPGVAVAA
jgi:hypothetical protein